LLWNALTGVDSGDPGTEIRLVLWSAAVQAFLDAPLIGHGWVGAQAIAAEAVGPEQAAVLYVQFHNDLGNFAVSAGLVGIAAYLLFLLGPIAGVLRSPADSFASGRAFAVCGIVLLYAVSGLTDITFGYDLPTVAYALMVALVLGSFRTRN
jgi:O-antigen ligase